MAPAKGELCKVWLKGGRAENFNWPSESLWAECRRVYADGSWLGRIDNHPVSTACHGIKAHDRIRFVPYPDAPNHPWQPKTYPARKDA